MIFVDEYFCVRRGFAPIEKRKFLQKFLQAFFKKPSVMNCSPFFSWCGSFLWVTPKKRSYIILYYLLYMFSYFHLYIYFPIVYSLHLFIYVVTAAKLVVTRHLCRYSASVLRPFVRQPCGWIRILGCKIYKILRSPAAKSLTKT